ncbi:MAG: hypothetical protein P8176_15710, partial [Gammaproteobacteria bacterium]
MTISQKLSAILCCPSCSMPVRVQDDTVLSEDGSTVYPIFKGIPWMIPNPQYSILDWQIKISALYEHLLNTSKQLVKEAPLESALTRQRLERLSLGKAEFARSLLDLTSPIMQSPPDRQLLRATLKDQAPRLQTVLSYEANVYRDWVWGGEENRAYCDVVMALLSTARPERVFIPGAGAGRLAHDLEKALSPSLLVAGDINPFLLFVAQRLMAGESIPLYEFPSEPVSLDDVVVQQHLSVENGASHVELVFSNLLQNPFLPASFDALITPWLVDILPYRFSNILRAINRCLPEGGCWINFGSLVFHHRSVAACYTFEELSDVVRAHGFEIEKHSLHEMPYLRSPHNAGYRMEKVWAWRAVKTKDVEPPEREQVLPLWILDDGLPVPALAPFSQSSQHQLITGEILSWAN